MGEIFLSYSRHDQQFADSLTNGLQGHGIQVWVDQQNLQGGDSWRSAISEAIAACDAFVVVLSPDCVRSKNVTKELSIAESHDRHIVPIMFRTCEIPPAMDYQLADLHWIDFSEMGFDAGLERLVATLRGGRAPAGRPMARQFGQIPSPPTPTPSGGAFPYGQAAQPAFAQPNLATLLCGRWNVQIGAAVLGPVGQAVLDMSPNGLFNGQIMTPAGMNAVTGQ